MNTDKELLASEKQVLTATPVVSTDGILMTGYLGADRSQNLRCIAQLETPLSGGAGTGITAEIIAADNAALTTNVTSLFSTGNIVTATANLQKRLIDVPMPKLSQAFLGFRFTSAGGAYAAGAVTAGIVIGTDSLVANFPVFETHGF